MSAATVLISPTELGSLLISAILANDNWSNADFVNELTTATGYVGAFALDAGSQDAATLSLVDPGAYTIQVSGAAASPTGEALVEVYEVP